MKYISSQRYLDQDTVEEKKENLASVDTVEVPCYFIEIDGEDYAIIADKHHTLAAARELGIPVKFVVGDHPEQLQGEDLLKGMWMDSPYYDIETGRDIW